MDDLTFALDAGSRQPLYEQLYRQLALEISSGRLRGGSRLPSRRALSGHLGVSEQTVNNALDLLTAEGFVFPKARQGLYVADLLPLGAIAKNKPLAVSAPRPLPRFDFSTQGADINLFPGKTWARLIHEVLTREKEVLGKADAQGDLSLRAAMSSFLYQYRGVHAAPEDIIIGSGVEQLLGIVGQLFQSPLIIACEDPGYPEAGKAFERAGHQVIPLAMDAQGVRAADLEASGARLAYLTPAHQYPTGISMPAGRRSELLHWAWAKEGRYLIEDDYDSEFRYRSRPLPALQGMDAREKTIYIGTFSRSLAPGIRIAHLALPGELARRYRQMNLRSGDAVSRFEQRALARLVEEGHYVRHLRKASGVYQKRCETLCGLLEAIPGAFLQGQEAGLHFLFGINGVSERELIEPAGKAGIPLQGLSGCRVNARAPQALVLGFAGLKDEEVGIAVSSLRACWGR